MSLFTRLASMFGRKGAEDDRLWGLGEVWSGAGLSQAGVAVNSLSAMQHVAVMACVSILSEDVAKLPIRVMRQVGKARVAVPNHWLNTLLRRPNAWQTQFEFVEMMQAALVLRGNAFAVILRDARGMPRALVPVHPDRISLRDTVEGEIFYGITPANRFERHLLRDQPVLVPAEDMFHLRWMSGYNPLMGASRVQLMREAIGLAVSQELQSAKLAGTGARPGGILKTDAILGKDVVERVRASWQENFGGLRNSGKTAILEQGLEWQPLGMTSVDAQWLESRKFQLEDIARGFRVPRHKLGMEQAGAANLVQLDQEYVNSVLSGYCTRWAQRMELDFRLDEEGVSVEFDYAELGKADIATRLNTARIGVLGMTLTPNEARQMAGGLPPMPGGDVLFQPTNMAEIGFEPASAGAGGAPGSDLTGAPAPGGDGDPAQLPS